MAYVRATDGCRIHYEVTGRRSAPPVLMIQGLGMDKHGWDLQRLAFRGATASIALDNRGAGRSDKPHGDYGLEQMADDAVAVLDDAGVDTAHVVGASMGGAISQILAVLYPERVRSLTLACTACRNHPWREELLAGWARPRARATGIGRDGQEAARWVIGPRSFRRLVPALGWLGPLGFGRPAHAFAAQVDGHPRRRRLAGRRARRRSPCRRSSSSATRTSSRRAATARSWPSASPPPSWSSSAVPRTA